MGKFKKLGACWKNEKKGYSCVVDGDIKEGTRLQMFQNDKDGNEKRPDIVFGVFEDDEETESKSSNTPEEDIPF